ncbi:LLM class flavin-dependent oxidoreductase [Novosphingobium sp.]|uniref:LLM class flavin-dependent oxidoreductase n=1 Tax=Novosphingobium sp. TaxID=1874826 RepID=UPI002733C476|nr:LLM class flavin-dependent oxidoreductase [Novosphingobium sp.]MDP3905922.1 LLM class flavin-dependent oxidoreductase [Novosphingobium sp.]
MAKRKNKLRLGLFIPPFHALNEDPTLCLERDLDLTQYADEIGLSEVWYGEHHSGGYEIIMSPELMIAAAAQRTKHIKLGTGVITLPYHNPLMVANRIAQLDHLTRGRVIFGAGPGILTADAYMMGQDAREAREKLDQGIGVIKRLLAGEWVTEKTSWYDLRDAHCHLLPYQDPLPIGVASAFTPSGGTLAAKHDTALLCLAATSPDGYDALSGNWKIAQEAATKYGRTMDPANVRCATDMHIAETREEAMAQARKGFDITQRYFINQTAHIAASPMNVTLDELVERGEAIVGTPDDAIAQIRRLEEKIPGFGTLLLFDKNWTGTEQKKRSLELMMRYVLPEINGTNVSRQKSFDWQGVHAEERLNTMQEATQRAFEKHAKENQTS